MKFSKNFSLAEIEHSNTAKRLGISNEMSEEHIENMQRLITDLILNSAIGGSNRSQHSKGQALDLQFWSEGKMNNKVIYDWILNSGLDFDQIINEFDFAWIHISLKDKDNRKQNLEAYKNEKGKTKYRYADI